MEADDFSGVVQQAANRGGDSDTIAAIAGGLAGTACGYSRIPKAYSDKLLIRGRLDEAAVGLYRLHG